MRLGGTPGAIIAELEARDERLLAAYSRREEVVLRLEHDLYDRLQLLDVLALVATTAVGACR